MRIKYNSKPDIDITIGVKTTKSSVKNNFSPSEISVPEDAKVEQNDILDDNVKTVNTRFSTTSSKKRIKYSNTGKLFKITSTRKSSRSISKDAKSYKNKKESSKNIINDSNLSVASTSGVNNLPGYSTLPRLKSANKILPEMGKTKRIVSPKIDFVALNKKRALYLSKSHDRKKNRRSDSEGVLTPSRPKRLKSNKKYI